MRRGRRHRCILHRQRRNGRHIRRRTNKCINNKSQNVYSLHLFDAMFVSISTDQKDTANPRLPCDLFAASRAMVSHREYSCAAKVHAKSTLAVSVCAFERNNKRTMIGDCECCPFGDFRQEVILPDGFRREEAIYSFFFAQMFQSPPLRGGDCKFISTAPSKTNSSLAPPNPPHTCETWAETWSQMQS